MCSLKIKMVNLVSEWGEGDAPLHAVLDCAARIVGLTQSGQVDATRRLGEGSLSTLLSASRSTVRSTLDHLEMIGLAKRVPRAGTFLKVVGPRQFSEVMDVRAALEGLCVRLLAARATDPDLENLKIFAAEVDALTNRLFDNDRAAFEETAEKDLRFHLTIAKLSGNSRLVSTLAQQRLIEQSYHLAETARKLRPLYNRPVPSHVEIVEAIASRDPAQAELVMRRHILRTKELRLGTHSGEVA